MTENDARAATPAGSMLGSNPMQTAADLTTALKGMTDQLADVKKTVRRGKLIAIGIIAGLTLDVALTVVVSITAVEASDAGARANATVAQLHSTQVSACESGNQTRAQEIALWTHLADLSITAKTTPAQRKADDSLLAYIRKTFAPKDCQAVYHLKGSASGRRGGSG